jgi:pimeloyl-ACP methyl ester carboxylesterase
VPYTGAPPNAFDLYVKQSVYGEAFASSGVSRRDMALPAASQRPLSTRAFDVASGPPAWASIPSWAVVGTRDLIIPIADQISMAKNAGARIVQIDAPHLSMVTDNQAVYDVIVKAANAG